MDWETLVSVSKTLSAKSMMLLWVTAVLVDLPPVFLTAWRLLIIQHGDMDCDIDTAFLSKR